MAALHRDVLAPAQRLRRACGWPVIRQKDNQGVVSESGFFHCGPHTTNTIVQFQQEITVGRRTTLSGDAFARNALLCTTGSALEGLAGQDR